MLGNESVTHFNLPAATWSHRSLQSMPGRPTEAKLWSSEVWRRKDLGSSPLRLRVCVNRTFPHTQHWAHAGRSSRKRFRFWPARSEDSEVISSSWWRLCFQKAPCVDKQRSLQYSQNLPQSFLQRHWNRRYYIEASACHRRSWLDSFDFHFLSSKHDRFYVGETKQVFQSATSASECFGEFEASANQTLQRDQKRWHGSNPGKSIRGSRGFEDSQISLRTGEHSDIPLEILAKLFIRDLETFVSEEYPYTT